MVGLRTDVRVMGALALVAFASGCPRPEERPLFTEEELSLLVVDLGDLQTGVHPETITIDLRSFRPWLTHEEFEASELASWRENFRVVHWPDATPVQGTWSFDWERPSGEMQFVPARPFDDGWYALQIRPDRFAVPRGFYFGYGQVTRDGWSTARFHVGSFPLLLASGGISEPEGEQIGGIRADFVTTERVFARSALELREIITVTVDGRPLECNAVLTFAFTEGQRVDGPYFHCGYPGPPGVVRIELAPLDWTTSEGEPVHVCSVVEEPTGPWLEPDCDEVIREAAGSP